MATERTLCIIKPDAVEKKKSGAILQHLLEEGFNVLAMRQAQLSLREAQGLAVILILAGLAFLASRFSANNGQESWGRWLSQLSDTFSGSTNGEDYADEPEPARQAAAEPVYKHALEAVRRAGLNPDALGARIDQFLASRGFAIPAMGSDPGTGRTESATPVAAGPPAEFVCEEDVRQALRAGRKIVLDSRTIVTPAARDLGEEKRVFIDAR